MNKFLLRNKLFPNNPYLSVAQKIEEVLSEYEFHCPESALYELTRQWVEDELAQDKTKSSILKNMKKNPNQAASVIAAEILSEMAEERPGTDPFDHPGRIPISLSALLWVTQGLTMASGVAMFNNNNALAQESIAGVIALLNKANDPTSLEELTLILGKEGLEELDLEESIILVPQSGLAYVARKLEGTLHNIEDGFWAYPVSESESQDFIYESIYTQAELVRDLNAIYGESTDPKEIS